MSFHQSVQSLVVQKNASIHGNLNSQTIQTSALTISGRLVISQETTLDGFNHRDFQLNDVKCHDLFVSRELQASDVRCGNLFATDIDATRIRTSQMELNSARIGMLESDNGLFRSATVPDLTTTNIVAVNLTSSDIHTNSIHSIHGNFSNSIQLGASTTLETTSSKPIVCKIPDLDIGANFVMSEGNQTIHGVKTLADPLLIDHSIVLPSRGGIPSPFNHYEVKQMELILESKAFETGTAKITICLVRVGQLVTCQFTSFMTQGSNKEDVVLSHNWIPRQFRPADTEMHLISVIDNLELVSGKMNVNANGTIKYGLASNAMVIRPLSGKGHQGFERFAMSWIVT